MLRSVSAMHYEHYDAIATTMNTLNVNITKEQTYEYAGQSLYSLLRSVSAVSYPSVFCYYYYYYYYYCYYYQ